MCSEHNDDDDDKHIETGSEGDEDDAEAGNDDSPDGSDGLHTPTHPVAMQHANAARHPRTYIGDKPVHGAR